MRELTADELAALRERYGTTPLLATVDALLGRVEETERALAATRNIETLREQLGTWLTDDWNYAYRRFGPRMDVEYEARQALSALVELEHRLRAYEAACAALASTESPDLIDK